LASKSELRDRALRQRDATDPHYRSEASAAIAGRVWPLVVARRPGVLAAYVGMRSEVDPAPLVAAAHAAGILVGLPAVLPAGGLVFRRHEPGDLLVPGGFGTMVPPEAAPPVDPDVVIVPLVGFDRTGTRLGYGKGHYDRTIAALRARGLSPTLIGVAFSRQEVDTIPHEPHDVRLDVIVTETGILDPRAGGTEPR
jgi:5-formyltetrahydrofolate cyclo-ligase